MQLNKKQGRFLKQVIAGWMAEGVVSQEMAEKLNNSYTIQSFDWKRLAKYSFWIALICGVIAIGAVVADDYLIKLVEDIFSSSYIALCIAFAVLSGLVYFLGLRMRIKRPEKVFSNEAIIFVGVLLTAASIAYLGLAVDEDSEHYSLLFLLSTFVYGVLGLWFPSRLVWTFAIISVGAWFGTETGYVSGWGMYFLGMNFPLRFVLFGGVLVMGSFLFKLHPKLAPFFKNTYILGMLYLFIALWILSIFGNYGDMHSWHRAKQIELFHWSILFALAALAAIVYGLKYDDGAARGFGITFLFINLYTRYFEYFWDGTHKAIFFLVLALSFWFIGTRAEKIWNLKFFHKGEKEIED